MGTRDQTPAHEITPPEFLDEYLAEFDADRDRVADVSTDQLAEALRLAERQPSTTDYDTMLRCPECLSPALQVKPQKPHTSDEIKGDHGCHECGAHFDEPRAPLAECPLERASKWLLEQHAHRTKHLDTMPINTLFEWLSNSELTDPAERSTLDPPLAGVDRETAVEAALRLREPWRDGETLSYTEIARYLPYADSWVGHRVREWRDGEHRDLVERPGPTVDDESDATALATDGGRRRRWDAYGTEGSTG
jgi:hypothetical protein